MKKSKAPGICVFCGAVGVSAEHVFGEWMSDLFPNAPRPKSYPQHYSAVGFNFDSRKGQSTSETTTVRGHPLVRRVRRPCEPCNNGWMSMIEDAGARPMRRLIHGDDSELSIEDLRAIATWAFLKAVIAEYTGEESRCIPDADRHFLFQHREPPPNYRIHLALNAQRHESVGYLHRFIGPEGADQMPRPIPDAIQSTATKAGHLFLFMLGPCDERADALVFDDLPLTQIWPPSGRSERPHFVSPWIIDSVANETLGQR
jgi:hypothetical protein